MSLSSKIKKTITMAGLLAISATAVASEIKTHEDALEQLTGPNQPTTGKSADICVAVTPYFVTSRGSAMVSHFFSLQIDGMTQMSKPKGECDLPDETGSCKKGFIKITATAPIACIVPVGL